MDKLDTTIIETPVGKMQAVASANGLCALEFVKPDRQKLLAARLSRWFSYERLDTHLNSHIKDAELWLQSYFNGQFDNLFAVALDMRGTPFELSVWKELRQIEVGQTISYSELAARVDNPKASRAVGGASRRNPASIIVPCHRVIGMTGNLTGYGGGIEQKDFLISHETSCSQIPKPLNLQRDQHGNEEKAPKRRETG